MISIVSELLRISFPLELGEAHCWAACASDCCLLDYFYETCFCKGYTNLDLLKIMITIMWIFYYKLTSELWTMDGYYYTRLCSMLLHT